MRNSASGTSHLGSVEPEGPWEEFCNWIQKHLMHVGVVCVLGEESMSGVGISKDILNDFNIFIKLSENYKPKQIQREKETF